jgi:hypothetical protein
VGVDGFLVILGADLKGKIFIYKENPIPGEKGMI